MATKFFQNKKIIYKEVLITLNYLYEILEFLTQPPKGRKTLERKKQEKAYAEEILDMIWLFRKKNIDFNHEVIQDFLISKNASEKISKLLADFFQN